MPYIDQETRAMLAPSINRLARELDGNGAGIMNFAVTRLFLSWLGRGASYADYNAALGVLEAVKLELYRRVVAPYEDVKRRESGDVFPPTGESCP